MNRGRGRDRGHGHGARGGRGAGAVLRKPLLRARNPLWIWVQF
jgi:hypothetical protein